MIFKIKKNLFNQVGEALIKELYLRKIKLNYGRERNIDHSADRIMVIRIVFFVALASAFCAAQRVAGDPQRGHESNPIVSPMGCFMNKEFGTKSVLFAKIIPPHSASVGQIDTAAQLNYLHSNRTSSIKADLLRSAIGSAIGGIVGVGIGGFLPVFLRGEYNSRDFPNNSFYLRSYVSASVLAALSSATALHLSKQREISYWKFASYSFLPPMLLVMPLSVYASVNPEREELLRSVWAAAVVSVGVSTLWSVLVYRIHPSRESGIAVSFGKPFLGSAGDGQNLFRDSAVAGVRIIEAQF